MLTKVTSGMLVSSCTPTMPWLVLFPLMTRLWGSTCFVNTDCTNGGTICKTPDTTFSARDVYENSIVSDSNSEYLGIDAPPVRNANSLSTTAKNGMQTTATNGMQTTAKNGMQTTAENGTQTPKNGMQTIAKNGMQTTHENGMQTTAKNGSKLTADSRTYEIKSIKVTSGQSHFTVRQSKLLTKDDQTSHQTSNESSTQREVNPVTYGKLNLTLEDLANCFAVRGSLEFAASEGVVTLDPGDRWKDNELRRCDISIKLPPGHVMRVQFTEAYSIQCVSRQCDRPRCDRPFKLPMDMMFYAMDSGEMFLLADCDSAHTDSNPVYSPYTQMVKIDVVFDTKITGLYSVIFSFTALAEVPDRKLKMVFVSSSTGFIQTPGWDGTTLCPKNMDSEVQLDPPADHSLMASVVFMDLNSPQTVYTSCIDDFVQLSSAGRRLAGFCPYGVNRWTTQIATPLVVTFRSGNNVQYTGFRLQFSFHNHSASPQQLPDGQWNCSVPYWPDFRQHLTCNLLAECAGGEDEAECPYTSRLCGRGRITLGGRCYGYRRSFNNNSWEMSREACHKEGGYLVSINTPQEWEDIIGLLKKHGNQSYNLHIGLKYKLRWEWDDGSVSYFIIGDDNLAKGLEGHLKRGEKGSWVISAETVCVHTKALQHDFLCEFGSQKDKRLAIVLPVSRVVGSRPSLIRCRANHTGHAFLACDVRTACWARDKNVQGPCPAPLSPLPPSFACSDGHTRVPFIFVCDYRPDCPDKGDESFCVFPPCQSTDPGNCQQPCRFIREDYENNMAICTKLNKPTCARGILWSETMIAERLPASVDISGIQRTISIPNMTECPETHFSCVGGDFYCLPIFVRCNGHNDCPDHEDEADCDSYTCPGYYRCRDSRICISEENLCDKLFHCPLHDDELDCDTVCPANCTCYGPALFCTLGIPPFLPDNVRFLDATGSGISIRDLANATMLVFLSLAKCGLTQLDHMNLPNLYELDLSDNHLTLVSSHDLRAMNNLHTLVLSGNPLKHPFLSPANTPLVSVSDLDLSRVSMPSLNVSIFSHFPNLWMLNLSNAGVDLVTDEGFGTLAKLRVVDLRGSPMTQFPAGVFKGLDLLETVYADNYKLCCPIMFSHVFNVRNCHAPSDEISSCDALLRSSLYRFVLSVFAVLALTGNLTTFLFWTVFDKNTRHSGYGVFVIHLCVSDFLMGVYLAVIGVADRIYYGTYLWNDLSWRSSVMCKTAGFISLLSNETSAFFIFLITLDRFLVLRFPFGQVRFRKQSAHWACVVAWLFGLCVSTLPFLPMLSHLHFYGNTGICVPLPITSKDKFPGYPLSFGVMVVLNFVLFVLIAAGQIFVYLSVRANSMSVTVTNNTSKELLISRRLISVATTDFLCWFPVGLLGVLASQDVPIPGEVNVAMAVIALPINSALNPFLYTINLVLERRRLRREGRLRKYLTTQIQHNREHNKIS